MRIYKIKNLNLKNPYFLAPMLEVNDIAFRLLCKKAGASLTYAGMTNPRSKKELILDDKPALQIFCTNTKNLKEFIKKYDKKVSLFDFNLGCPSKIAKRLGFGSFMHSKLEEIEKILKTIKKTTKKPLTIKLRKSPKIDKILKIAEKYCDAVCIHPRTQKQGYSGKTDLKFALALKEKTKLPVIYSGDATENNASELLKKFDFVMIGRKAIGNPNIFAKLTHKKIKKLNFRDYMKLAGKYKLSYRQIKFQAVNFTKGMKNAKEVRRKLVFAKAIKEIENIMCSF